VFGELAFLVRGFYDDVSGGRAEGMGGRKSRIGET
jgi:hypothetical protein